MSVFRVNLDQGLSRLADGYLDPSKVNGYSIQRTIYVAGPNRINRKLFDGDTFTDVNYWKRFAYPQLPQNEAFIEVVTDDGSVWYDGKDADNSFPRSYNLTIAGGSTFANNVVNILNDTGGAASFCQITVVSGSDPVFRFNGLANATMVIAQGTTQVFDKGDLSVSKIEIDNSASGSATTVVDIFVSVKAVAQS